MEKNVGKLQNIFEKLEDIFQILTKYFNFQHILDVDKTIQNNNWKFQEISEKVCYFDFLIYLLKCSGYLRNISIY